MLKTLIRLRLTALGKGLIGSGLQKKRQSKGKIIGFCLLMLYAFGALCFMFWHYFSSMALPFHSLGLDWLYYALVGVCDFSLMFIGSVFFAKAQLYEAKDNELLLSMPIAPGDILLSRTAMLLGVSFAFGLPAAVPALVIGIRDMGLAGTGLLAFCLLFLLLPLFALALSALFGWVLSVLTARVKHKSLFGTVLCILVIVLYSLLVGKVNTTIMDLAAHADGIARAVGAVAPVYLFGCAIAKGGLGLTLAFVAGFLLSAALVYALLSMTFIRTATARRGFAKTRYVERKSAAASPDTALFRRELARLGSSSAYIMNAGMGIIMLLLGTGALLIKRRAVMELLSSAPEAAPLVPPLLVAALCLFATMNLISAPSVSLEGQNLWIVLSLPVSAWQALRAKLRVHLAVCLPPMLLVGLACLTVFSFTLLQAVLLLAVPAAMTVFIGLLGLAENLRHPNLDWTNEAQAVKTGFGLLFTMLISWGTVALPAVLVLLIGDMACFEPVALGFLGLLVLASLLLRTWLKGRGAELFRSL